MDQGESTLKTTLVTYFPMFIATLSLLTSIYNGYLNSKFVDLIDRNVGRVEYMKTCKEIIDAYFQVKLRARLLSARAGAGSAGAPTSGALPSDAEGMGAVAHFAALGTYLANLRDEAVRVRYTELSDRLRETVAKAASVPPEEIDKLFEPADRLFSDMNDDCVRSAKAVQA